MRCAADRGTSRATFFRAAMGRPFLPLYRRVPCSMTSPYRIFGAELSPYSCKVRAYARYKRIAHEWVPRGPANDAEFQRYAKLPLVPLLVTPEGVGIQDSTPIMDALDGVAAKPSTHPEEAVA